ncbi:MAG: glycosyltransferase family 1 protein [Bacteroidales bacterium]|nr:glycosyltransferase family 1 protein [Bacteroidales bacterium]
MKIGIEGQRLFRKKKHGMDMVALELIRNLQEIDTENEYFIYIAPDEDDTCLQETSNFHIRKLDGGFYPFWEQIALPKAAKADGCQILHCTSNTSPVRTAIPLVTTLHDIIYMEKSVLQILRGSGTAYQNFGNVYRRLVVPRVVKSSSIVITVSHFEKNRIADVFHLNDNKLRAVYNGVSTHFKRITDTEELARTAEKYHLPPRFLFHLGNTDPKKNTQGVLNAYASYLKQNQDDIPLVMLDFDEDELSSMILKTGSPDLRKNIKLTGYVINTDLPAIYSLCEAFLYPSLRESFGIPILEAMACGAPVLTGNTSSMPEIAGDAALIIDPYDHIGMASSIQTIIQDTDLRQNLTEKGYTQAAKFSWRAMSENVLNIYRELAVTHKL